MSYLLKKKYFEEYLVKVPFSKIGKNFRPYICHELEKIHPAFDDMTSFDYKPGLNKEGIFAKVFVVNRLFLESSGIKVEKGLCLEGNGRRRFFGKKGYRKYLLLSLFVPVIFFVFFHFTLDKKVNVIEENITQCNEAKDFEEDKLKMNLVLLKYLNLINKHNGRITSLSFDGNSISMNICSIFPEYLMEESSDEKNAAYYFSPVSYVEEKPSFNLEVKRKKIKTYGNVCKKELFFSFRNLLLANGSVVRQENFSSMQISFEISKNNFEECFLAANNFLTKEKMNVESIFINPVKNKIIVNIKLFSDSDNENILSKLCLYKKLFFDYEENNNENIYESDKENVSYEPVNPEETMGSNYEKNFFPEIAEENQTFLGKISFSNGGSIFYYKNSEGKIRGFKNEF